MSTRNAAAAATAAVFCCGMILEGLRYSPEGSTVMCLTAATLGIAVATMKAFGKARSRVHHIEVEKTEQ